MCVGDGWNGVDLLGRRGEQPDLSEFAQRSMPWPWNQQYLCGRIGIDLHLVELECDQVWPV